jgi:chemotaxis protein CheZ
MARPQKAFRIENFVRPPVENGAPAGNHVHSSEIIEEIRALRRLIEPQETLSATQMEAFKRELSDAKQMKAELDAIQEAIEQTKHEIATVHTTGFKGAQMVRVTGELDAIVQGTLDATDLILTAAEHIDRDAHSLEAAVTSKQDQQVASDILENVIKIFEACNFQDLTGQRITKVVGTLKFIEESFRNIIVDEAPAAHGDATLLNGPRLATDGGHASQDDIDALFN